MKKFLTFWAVLLFAAPLFAQNLTLSELVNLGKKAKWEQVDTFLKKKKWTFFETSNTDQGKVVMWSFKKEKDSNRAAAWIMLTILNEKPSKLSYEFGTESTLKGLKKATLMLKLKEVSTDVRTDGSAVSYKNPTSWIVFNTSTGKLADRLTNTPATSYSVDLFPMFGAFDSVNGTKRETYPGGTLKSEYTLRGGKIDGTMKQYYPSGKLSATAAYAAGVKQGLATEYEEDGTLKAERTFQNGLVLGEVREYANGKVTHLGTFVNGKKEGVFADYTPEGNILSKFTMKGDSLHGRYVKNVYDGGNLKYTVTGDYDNGLRNGYWETASTAGGEKVVCEYVGYLLGVRDGKFREQQGDSLRIGTYRAGRLDGRVDVFHFDSDEVKSGTPNIVKARQTEMRTYSNGVLNGSYECRDANGVVVARGSMANGSRDGEWTIARTQPDEQGKPTMVFHKGSFIRNMEVGEWTVSTIDNVTIKRYSLKNGKVDGRMVEYSWSGKPLREKLIENEKLLKLSLYDSLGKAVSRTVDVVADNDREIRCKLVTQNEKGFTTCGYWLNKKNCKPITVDTFEKIFLDNAVNSTDSTKGGADGEIKGYGKDNVVLFEGRYRHNTKVDRWKRFSYEMEIMVVVDYSKKGTPVENYLDLPTGKPYTGRFVEAYDNGQNRCDFKIYSGLRDGKSKYYDQDGKVVKEETYAQGILKR